jgi:hypothetical protein
MRTRKLRKPVLTALLVIPVLLAIGMLVNRQLSIRKEQRVLDSIHLEVDASRLTVEAGTVFHPLDAVVQCDGDLQVEGTIDTSVAGSQPFTYIVTKPVSRSKTVSRAFPYTVTVIDTVMPEITLEEELVEIMRDEAYDPDSNIRSVTDGRGGSLMKSDTLEPGSYTVVCEPDLTAGGDHLVTITAMTASGNTSEASYHLVINEATASENPYRIRINRTLNCVTVYAMDENHAYTIPVKAMVCSTGPATPAGTFHTFNRSTWRALFGGVYGQYATDIVGDILFHSVPYYSMNKNDLEYLEYNKLGTAASMGCIRMAVSDVLWVFNNCPIGTEVEIYDDPDDPGPLGKPEPIHIDETSELRGWDPTDPDPANPWNP